MKQSERKSHLGLIWMILGLLLVTAALLLAAYNLHEERIAKEQAIEALRNLEAVMPEAAVYEPARESADPQEMVLEEANVPAYIRHPEMEMPTVEVDGVEYLGMLEIPALSLTVPIISQWSYPMLKIAPCRYEGSAYLGDMILCGHNYEGHFKELKNLVAGDFVTFTDVDGNVFRYEVTNMITLEPTAVEDLEAGSGDWDLSLLTCTVGGQTRLVVRCEELEP